MCTFQLFLGGAERQVWEDCGDPRWKKDPFLIGPRWFGKRKQILAAELWQKSEGALELVMELEAFTPPPGF